MRSNIENRARVARLAVLLSLTLKVDRPGVLAHPRRADLLEFIRGHPGVHLRALSHELHIGLGVLRLHLRALHRAGLIRTRRAGRRRIYLAPGYEGTAGRSRGERIYAHIDDADGITQIELAHRIGVSRMLVHYHVRRMQRDGSVVADREGRGVRLYAARLPRSGGAPTTRLVRD